MFTFEIRDMTCGHCASTITKAAAAIDAAARVEIDLERKLVQVRPGAADAPALADAITQAGFTPVHVDAGAARPAASGGGCCCSRG